MRKDNCCDHRGMVNYAQFASYVICVIRKLNTMLSVPAKEGCYLFMKDSAC